MQTHQTDKVLLELAAKAAGMTYHFASIQKHGGVVENYHSAEGRFWNPLTDDGDALRLAVKLGIDIEEALGWYYNNDEDDEYQKDPYAATRRAIVRAAAEIGKTL